MERTKEQAEAIAAALADGRALLERAMPILKANGIEMKVGEDWLTVSNYCKRFEIADTQLVTNWIKRGIIPPENVQVVEELNGLRLIKAVPYR